MSESPTEYHRVSSDANVLFPAGVWTEGLERNRQQLQLDYFAMKQRAEKAEMRADSADWAAATLEAENKALNATIVARDQWAAQLTEQYAAREVQVKAALEYCKGKMGLINKARYIAELLDITLN